MVGEPHHAKDIASSALPSNRTLAVVVYDSLNGNLMYPMAGSARLKNLEKIMFIPSSSRCVRTGAVAPIALLMLFSTAAYAARTHEVVDGTGGCVVWEDGVPYRAGDSVHNDTDGKIAISFKDTNGDIIDPPGIATLQGGATNSYDPPEGAKSICVNNVAGLRAGCSDDCKVAVGFPIPAASEWGMIVITLLLLTAITVVFGRRRRAATA